MKRALAAFAIISLFSCTQLTAQVGAPYVSIDFYTYSMYDETYTAIPLRNTINDLIGVFYNWSYTGARIYFHTIYPTGLKGTQLLVVTLPGSNPAIVMDAAWHPKSNCYLVVYMKNNNAFYGRIVKFYPNSNRPMMLTERYITKYTTGTRIKVAPANKGKFIVFLNNGLNLSAISLNDDATNYKPLKTLTNYSNGVLHLGGAEREGVRTAAYIFFVPNAGTTAELRMVKVNNKLTRVKSYDVKTMTKPSQYFVFLGKYDPVNRIHTAIVENRYCTFTQRGRIEFALSNLPTNEQPRSIAYDPVNQCFGLMTVDFYEDPNTYAQGANIYLSTYDYQGTFLTPETYLLGPSGQEGNPGSFRVEYAPNGFYLITYALEWMGLSGAYFN